MGTCGHGTWAMSHVPMPPCPMSPCHAPCGTPACHNAQRTTHTPIMWFPTLDPSRLPRVIATTIQRRLDMATWHMGTWGHGTWGHGDMSHGDMGHGTWMWPYTAYVYTAGLPSHMKPSITSRRYAQLCRVSNSGTQGSRVQGPWLGLATSHQPPATHAPCPPCQIIRLGGWARHLRSSQAGPQ